MRLFASVAVLSLALGSAVSAQTEPAPDQPAVQAQPAPAPSVDKKRDGVICRRETPTGSLFPVKVCTTAAQRKAEGASTRKAQESMQGAGPTIPN